MTRSLRARAGVALLAVLLVLGAAGLPASSPAGAAVPDGAALRGAQAATGYLLAAQNRDGGFGAAPGQSSLGLFSGWAALGLASAGEPLGRVSHGGPSLLAYLQHGPIGDVGSLERTILALRAAGASPRRVGGLVHGLLARVRRNGSIADQVNLTAFGILALRAAGVVTPAATRAWLIAQQDPDGGFGFATRGGTSDPDDTGAALEALAGDRGAATARARAVDYLRRVQVRDGGFPSGPGSGSNAQSTAWAVQGLIAAGVAPDTVRRPGGATPLDYLVSLTSASGRVSYARGTVETPVWVTAETLMALEGRPLPITAPAPAAAGVAIGAATRDDLAAVAGAAGTLAALVLAPIGV